MLLQTLYHVLFPQVAGGSVGRKVSYPYFKAFNQLLGNLDILGQVVQSAVDKNKGSKVTQSKW